MSDAVIHDLAVAYAQAKLIQYQQENPDMTGYDEEIRVLLNAYNHAYHQILDQHKELDENF